MTMAARPPASDIEVLGAFDHVLAALARGLDVPELLRHLSAAASRVLDHDEAHLALLTEDGTAFRLFTATPNGLIEDIGGPAADTVFAGTAAALLGDGLRQVPGLARGLASGLEAPVTIEGRIVAVLGLFARRAHAYSPADVRHAERFARYLALGLAHRRLAGQARDAALEWERAAGIESSVELLRTISDVLDIRAIFPRVSEIAGKTLPHDALSMGFVGHDRRVHLPGRVVR